MPSTLLQVSKHADLDDYLRRLRGAGGPRETNAVMQRAMGVALTPVLAAAKRRTPKRRTPYNPGYNYPNRSPGTLRRSLKKSVGKTRVKKVPPIGYIASEGDMLANIYHNYKGTRRKVKSIMVGFPPAPKWRIYGEFNRGVISPTKEPNYTELAEKSAPQVADKLQEYIGRHLKERLG